MQIPHRFMPKVFKLYLEISLYPILSRTIRARMREELFRRGFLDRDEFEREVNQKAIRSQAREGLTDPFGEENARDWNERVELIRSQLTDFYFAYNLPHSLFQDILNEIISQRGSDREVRLSFNPEIAPWDVLFAEGERYERLPPHEREKVSHHLREIKAVLIKAMISDHLHFVGLAREAFTIAELKDIRARRLGRGKIGGKAASLLLAAKHIQLAGAEYGLDPSQIDIPESYFIGSDLGYEVHQLNDFYPFMNQKYKPTEEIIADYPTICERYVNATLPEYFLQKLRDLLDLLGPVPLVFRSSSLLEDRFDVSFAGKYDSYFLPNQGSLDERLAAAKEAVMRIHASVLNPDALIYRKRMGLTDFNERMAILIQKVEGQQYGRYFFPMLAGVGFSLNPFRWSPRIRREDGLLRLVCGLGTRAVDRVARDFPRMIALSHPQLRPEVSSYEVRQHSQHFVDVLDMEDRKQKTLPIQEAIGPEFPILGLIASRAAGKHLDPYILRPKKVKPEELVFTFDQLVQRTDFAQTMRKLMYCLREKNKRQVDIEFAIKVIQEGEYPKFRITLLQCRGLNQYDVDEPVVMPRDLPDQDILFTASRQVPSGIVTHIRYVVMVRPSYFQIKDMAQRLALARVVGRLNDRLEHEHFILIGPGRWGTSDVSMGVRVSYADISNSHALIEVAVPDDRGDVPEMAYGTHFFQDLVESRIYPLALFPGEEGNIFNWDFFKNAPNVLADLLPNDAAMADVLTVIDVPAACDGRCIELVMNAERDKALAYLKRY